MSITDIIMKIPFWYFLIMIVFSLYYAIRGVLEWTVNANYEKLDSRLKRIIYYYVQEILFKIIFTVSGFMALLVANYIFSSVKSISEIGVGAAIILIFLIIWGISGVSGYLTFLIVSGKFPMIGKLGG